MGVLSETLIISGTIAGLGSLPLLSKHVRSRSKLFFLLGTGALAGILGFDLLPDIFQMGGSSSLWMIGAVWLLYTLVHLFHLKHHEHEGAELEPHLHMHAAPPWLFLASMMTHCLASGILLVVSSQLGQGLGRTVFFALLAHKGYEALTVSSILVERRRSKAQSIVSIALYAISFPAGVALAVAFHSSISQGVALLATSIAAGTLVGCLIYDFLLPSLSRIRERKYDLAWVAAGLVLTQLVMRMV